jgi:hypothetical protein
MVLKVMMTDELFMVDFETCPCFIHPQQGGAFGIHLHLEEWFPSSTDR